MILVVDIGNSNIVLGLFKKCTAPTNNAEFIWRVHTDVLKTADEYSVIIRSLFVDKGIKIEDMEFVFISSVVPVLTQAVFNALKAIVKTEPVCFSPKFYDLLPVSVSESARNQIGTDLLANAVAGYLHFKSECVIVDFGTALTFTVVDKAGRVSGVAIAPGMQTAVKSLFSNTAQLTSVLLEAPKSVLGTDTTLAIQSGIVFGYSELVAGMLRRIRSEQGFENASVIATGGLSHLIENSEKLFAVTDKQLTLKGLACIATLISA